MNRLLLICMCVLALSILPAQAQSIVVNKSDFEEQSQLLLSRPALYALGTQDHPEIQQIYTYYQNKNPQQAVTILKNVSDAQLLKTDPTIGFGILGFTMGLFFDNPQQMQTLLQKNQFSPEITQLIQNAQHIATTFKSVKNMLQKRRERGFSSKQLDAFWGLFFATGDQQIPEEMAYFALNNEHPKEIENGKVVVDQKVITAITARASLQSNAIQHPKVKKAMQNSHMSTK